MGKILHWLEHELRGLDDESDEEGTPLTLVVGVLVFVVPVVVLVLGAAFGVYFSV
jgi:hypothetical protein